MMEPRLPKVGELVAGRYRILQELGQGGYGVVYRARQDAMGRDVAIKILRPEAAKNEVEVERFRREVFHASGLRHPNTITLYDFGETNGLFFIIMEHLEGLNLRDYLMQHGPFAPDAALDIVEQVLRALREAHEHGIVHRDLKPENVFLCNVVDDERVVKVLDFGLSKYVPGASEKEPTLTKDGVIFGTPQYMSPEQAYGQPISPATDIYALGLLTYEMLTTNCAFNGRSSMEILIKQVSSPIPVLPPEVQNTLIAELMDICVRKEIKERFQDASEALHWLNNKRNENSVVTMFQFAVEPPDEPAPTPPPVPTVQTRSAEHAASDVALRLAQMPLVGRQEELADLMEWSSQSLHHGGIASVTGPMGVGKSALVDEWTRLLALEGAVILRGRFREDGTVFDGIRQALRPIYDVDSAGDETMPIVLTPARIEELRMVLEPNIAADVAEPTAVGQDWRFATVENTIVSLARTRPIVVLLEDIHWADSFSLRFLSHWQEELATQTVPVLLVLTSRSDEFGLTAQLNELSRLSQRYAQVSFAYELEVSPLDDARARQVLDCVIPLADDVVDFVLGQARGNPLYLTEIARFMVDEALLEFDAESNKWWLRPEVEKETRLIPPNLRTLWIRRVKSLVNHHPLGSVLKAVLGRIVLIGGAFPLRLLKEVLKAEGRPDLESYLDDALDVLSRASLITPIVIDGRPGIEFGYGLVRKALVDSEISVGEDLPRLHLLIAEAKERSFTESDSSAGVVACEIAAHYRAAGDLRAAFSWVMRAAVWTRRSQDFRGALDRYSDAEALLDKEIDPSGERLLEIRLAQGELHQYLGSLGPAEYALRRALDEAGRVGDLVGEAMAGERLGAVLTLLAEFDEATRIIEHVRNLYRRFNDADGELRSDIGLAEISRYCGHYIEAEERFRDAMERAEQDAGDPQSALRCLFGLGQCAYASGRLDAARNLYRRARKRAEALGDNRMVAYADISLGLLAVHTTGVAEAEKLAGRALVQLRDIGDTLGVAHAHLILGIAIRRSVRMSEAQFHAKRALLLNERLAHRYGIAKAVLLKAEIAWMGGQFDEAVSLGKDAEALHRELKDSHGLALSKVYRALFECEVGNSEVASTLLRETLELTGHEGLGLYQPHCLFFMGLVHEKERNLEEAVALYGEALQLAEAIGNRETASLAATSLAKLHLVFGDYEAARQEVPVAKNQAQLLGSNLALIFALAGEALLARMDGNAIALRSALQALRSFNEARTGVDLHVVSRIHEMGLLTIDHQPPEKAKVSITALADILRSLGSPQLADDLLERLR